MKHTADLNDRTIDSEGNTPPVYLIGYKLRHSGNGKFYRVTDFVWNGQADTWMVAMKETDKDDVVTVVRPLHHIGGNREDGKPRYEIPLRS